MPEAPAQLSGQHRQLTVWLVMDGSGYVFLCSPLLFFSSFLLFLPFIYSIPSSCSTSHLAHPVHSSGSISLRFSTESFLHYSAEHTRRILTAANPSFPPLVIP